MSFKRLLRDGEPLKAGTELFDDTTCARCGLPRGEHHYNGACYGVCGEFIERTDAMSDDFHPDKNLPGCMMPDGGECCAGHTAVVEDWHKQRREIERLREEVSGLTAALSVTWSISEG